MDSVLLDLIKFWHKGKMDNHEFYYKDQLESYQSDLLDSLDESQLEKFKLYKTAEIDFNEEEIDLTEGSDFIKNIIALLKKTYVSNSSNETLYNYFYEKLYTNYAGTTASNGTYFLSIEYNWLSQLYRDGKIKFTNKLTYDELMDSLT